MQAPASLTHSTRLHTLTAHAVRKYGDELFKLNLDIENVFPVGPPRLAGTARAKTLRLSGPSSTESFSEPLRCTRPKGHRRCRWVTGCSPGRTGSAIPCGQRTARGPVSTNSCHDDASVMGWIAVKRALKWFKSAAEVCVCTVCVHTPLGQKASLQNIGLIR